ncbi:Fc.00g011240.m01.CDS01 [Cosmosporella sp. VM-42]
MVRFVSDSRPVPTSKVPLLVIGAGLPRAATSSLQAAFEELGFNPCLHMAQIIPHPDREQLLIDAAREKDTARRQKIIHELVDGYAAVCDMPAIFFTADLMDMYPDAKIILNGRPSPETWARSCFESLSFFFTFKFRLIGLLWKTDRLWYQINLQILKWCEEEFDETNIFTPGMYEKYYDSIREAARVRGKEVLDFKAEEGWEPLCKHLGKEVPATAFPRVNEKKTFNVIKGILIARGLLGWAVLGGVAWAGWTYSPALIKMARGLLLSD